jgi:hypothetical protein
VSLRFVLARKFWFTYETFVHNLAGFDRRNGDSMKHKRVVGLIFCLCLTATTLAQTSSQSEDDGKGGAGTPNFIVKFSGKHTIANSKIFQSPTTENIGIGTATPLFPVHVFSDNTLPPAGQDFPVALTTRSVRRNTPQRWHNPWPYGQF